MHSKKAILLIMMLAGSSYAIDSDLESFVRGSHGGSANLAQNGNAANVIPNYSVDSANQVGSDFENIDDAALKKTANDKIKEAKKSEEPSATAITVQSLGRKEIDNFENQDIFKKAEAIYQDPVKLLQEITKTDCAERLNDSQNHYTKHTSQEEKTDVVFEEKTCERPNDSINCTKMLTVTCDDSGQAECDAGGIVGDSIQGDIAFIHAPPTLTIGTIQRELWNGDCAVFDRAIKFNIERPEDITEFAIFEIGYDDYIWIKVNDATVYVGPDGGDRIELTTEKIQYWFAEFEQTVVTNGKHTSNCERMTDRLFTGHINLKDHLKQGENIIWMRVIVSGSGEGWMKIKAKQRCCTKLKDHWETICQAS